MAPEVHNDIKAMQREGMLNVVAGKIYYIGSDEDALTVEIAPEVKVKVEKNSVSAVVTRTEPANTGAEKAND